VHSEGGGGYGGGDTVVGTKCVGETFGSFFPQGPGVSHENGKGRREGGGGKRDEFIGVSNFRHHLNFKRG